MIFEFKLKIGKMLKHLLTFILMAYICVVSTKSYESFMNLGNVIQYDTKFISGEPILEKIAMIIERLLYSVFIFLEQVLKRVIFAKWRSCYNTSNSYIIGFMFLCFISY